MLYLVLRVLLPHLNNYAMRLPHVIKLYWLQKPWLDISKFKCWDNVMRKCMLLQKESMAKKCFPCFGYL